MNSPQVVLITGAARRVGAAIARELHGAGMNVLIHYRSSGTEARALAAELNRARRDSAHCLRADLRKRAALEKLAKQAHARWGRLDALVNNASSYARTPLGEITEAAFDELLGSNLKAPLFLIQACVPHILRSTSSGQGSGAIVNIADTKPVRAEFSAYGAAKSGLVALTQILARELAPRIRVNAVAPGHILWAEKLPLSKAQQRAELSRVPLKRLGTPEEIARAVKFLISPESSYITGAILPVDGGLRL